MWEPEVGDIVRRTGSTISGVCTGDIYRITYVSDEPPAHNGYVVQVEELNGSSNISNISAMFRSEKFAKL